MTQLFQFRKIGWLTPHIQILTIIGLYLATVGWSYFEYKQTGLVIGLRFRPSIVFVPIYEEILFRGLILGLLIKHFSNKKSILFSSILFGLWHLKNIFYLDSQVIPQILYTMLFIGPLFAYITLKTKTIWPAVILHYLNNILAGISGYLWMLYV